MTVSDLTLLPTGVVAERIERRATTEDPAAALYRELAPAVLGYLRSQRVPEPEDVLGDVFVKVARGLPRFRGDADACRRWVFTIAHHRIVDEWRRRRTRPEVVDGPVPDLAIDDRMPSIDPELQAALDGLTPEQRTVVLLRFVADLPLDDVARILRRRVGTVKALQHRGVAALQRTLPS